MDRPGRRIGVAAAIVLAIGATACGARSDSNAAASGDRAGTRSTFDVSVREFALTPSNIEAPAGTPLTFKVTNEGTAMHTFAVQVGSKLFRTDDIAAGSSATLDVDGLDAGSYKMFCTVPGHADLGMVGRLVVGGSGVGASAANGTSTGMAGMGGTSGSGMSSGTTMSADQMAQAHKAAVEQFPAKTEGTGNQPLRPKVQEGRKVFELTATDVRWETSPGTFESGMAFNGQIPGPEIRVHRGDEVRIVLNNQMTQPTVMHFHGMTVPNGDDGVPYVTQDPIMPGGYYVYDFTVKDPPGMYVYHSHFNSTDQVGSGLYGALLVEPKRGMWSYPTVRMDPATGQITGYGRPPAVDVESTLFLGDGPLGFVLNGKGFPATQPIVARRGDWVLIHLANDGSMLHPMHLHGYHFEVVSQDGFPLRDPHMADTLVIAPGQRFDVLVHAVRRGVWAFHCHILPHVEGPQGMYGMVTALVVQ